MALLLMVTSAPLPSEHAQLRLLHSIPLPGVEGRIDHMALDPNGQRLFVAALGNGSVEVVDLHSGKQVRSLRGFHEPQGVAFVPRPSALFVSNGGDGTCDQLNGDTLERVRTLRLSADADNVRYDDAGHRIYVGYGEGGLGVFDSRTGDSLGDIPLPAHPESFQLETSGSRIFVNVPDAGEVAVVERTKGSAIAHWKIEGYKANYPMALDEVDRRVFVGCRQPAAVLVLDSESGRRLAAVPIGDDCDDLFYDAATRRLVVTCGSGVVDVLDAEKSGRFTRIARIPTAAGARTSLFVPTSRRLYLAVPHRGPQQAEIRVFEVSR